MPADCHNSQYDGLLIIMGVGNTATEVARFIGITQPLVNISIKRGEKIVTAKKIEVDWAFEYYNFMDVPYG